MYTVLRFLCLFGLLEALVFVFSGGRDRSRGLGLLIGTSQVLYLADSPSAALLAWLLVLSAKFVHGFGNLQMATGHLWISLAVASVAIAITVWEATRGRFHLHLSAAGLALLCVLVGQAPVGAGVIGIGLLMGQWHEWELYRRWVGLVPEAVPPAHRSGYATDGIEPILDQPEVKPAFRVGTGAMTFAAAVAMIPIWVDISSGAGLSSWPMILEAFMGVGLGLGVTSAIRSGGMFAPVFLRPLQISLIRLSLSRPGKQYP